MSWPLIKLLPQKTNFQFVRFSRLMGIPLALVLAIAVIFLSANLVAEVRKLDKMEPEKTRILLERDDLAATPVLDDGQPAPRQPRVDAHHAHGHSFR